MGPSNVIGISDNAKLLSATGNRYSSLTYIKHVRSYVRVKALQNIDHHPHTVFHKAIHNMLYEQLYGLLYIAATAAATIGSELI
jgi:ribosomal protein L13